MHILPSLPPPNTPSLSRARERREGGEGEEEEEEEERVKTDLDQPVAPAMKTGDGSADRKSVV